MTLVLVGKGLVLEGSTLKIEDKQVPGTHMNGLILMVNLYVNIPSMYGLGISIWNMFDSLKTLEISQVLQSDHRPKKTSRFENGKKKQSLDRKDNEIIHELLLMMQKSCEPAEVGSLADFLQRFYTTQVGFFGFLNHQQYDNLTFFPLLQCPYHFLHFIQGCAGLLQKKQDTSPVTKNNNFNHNQLDQSQQQQQRIITII